MLSPAGFAVKVPASMRTKLIREGQGREFRFFGAGPVKRDYVGLSERILEEPETLENLLLISARYVNAGRA